jgi:hypothetical protein
VQVADRLSVAP